LWSVISVTLPASEVSESASEYRALLLQKAPERRLGLHALVLPGGVYELLEVLQAGLRLDGVLGLELFLYPDSSRTAPINSAGGTSLAATLRPSNRSRTALQAFFAAP
jgi:hypothetical protein